MNRQSGINDLASLVAVAARRWPDTEAWIFDSTDQRLTFSDIETQSTEFARLLRGLGVNPGDRVAVMLHNQPEFALIWLALAKICAILVPVNINYREVDGTHILRHSGARFAIADAGFLDLLHTIKPETMLEEILTPEALSSVRPASLTRFDELSEQPANIQYTSGTTGAPKGCILPHNYWTTIASTMITEHPNISSNDIILTAQPLHYIDPQWNIAVGLASGATLVVLDRFHPASFWKKVRQYGVTYFYCLGLMPTLLLRTPESAEDRSHRVRAINASAIPKNLHSALERRWGVEWFEAFGMTETGADIRVTPEEYETTVGTGCVGSPARHRVARILDSAGRALPPTEVGELVLQGAGMMRGYHNDSKATALAFRDGWFHTGDLATMDEFGRIYYIGREKDMIRRSGENIAAGEVEQVLLQHPDVELAAVVAVDDELRGEEIKAYVVLRPDNDKLATPDELAEFTSRKLAYFKIPRYWTFTDSLPLTPSERVAKGKLSDGSTDQRNGAYDRVDALWR